MTKTLLLATAVSIGFASVAMAADTKKISLNVSGVFWGRCAKALATALVQGGVKVTSEIKPNQGVAPVLVQGEIEADADLIKLGTAVNEAKTPHAKQAPPGVALLVFGKLDDASSSAALESLAPVKGVDSKNSKADAKEGQISVKLSGKDDDDDDDDATLSIADILTALEKAGILVSLSKT